MHVFFLLSDISLIQNNAHIGSKIALELSKLQSSHHSTGMTSKVCVASPKQTIPTPRPFVVGASIMDIIAKSDDKEILVSACNHSYLCLK